MSRLRLVVVCGSVSDERRLLEAAKVYRLAKRDLVIPRKDDTVTPEMHAAERERWIAHASLVVGVRKPDGTLGESATREVAYARSRGLTVNWYWPECTDTCPGCGWHQPPVPMPERTGWLECEECGTVWPQGRPQDRIKGIGIGRLHPEHQRASEPTPPSSL